MGIIFYAESNVRSDIEFFSGLFELIPKEWTVPAVGMGEIIICDDNEHCKAIFLNRHPKHDPTFYTVKSDTKAFTYTSLRNGKFLSEIYWPKGMNEGKLPKEWIFFHEMDHVFYSFNNFTTQTPFTQEDLELHAEYFAMAMMLIYIEKNKEWDKLPILVEKHRKAKELGVLEDHQKLFKFSEENYMDVAKITLY